MIKIDKASSKPIYLQVKEMLLDEISSGRIAPKGAIPNERTLAGDLELSRMTVRRAIVELADEGIVERVRGRGTFVKAGKGASQKQLTIAIVATFDQVAVKDSLFYYRIIQGIHQATEEARVSVMIRKLHKPYDDFVGGLTGDAGIDGLIALGIIDQDLLVRLANCGIPTVLVDSSQPGGGPALDQVCAETSQGSYQAVKSLLELGHERVELLTFKNETPSARSRRHGWERALREHGITPTPDMIHGALVCIQGGYDVMKQMLATGLTTTAIFCAADEFAVGAMAAVAEADLKIPRDLSIAGVGDVGYFTSPPLSTVSMQMEQMGLKAVQVIRDRIDDPAAPPQIVDLPSEYVAKATCAAPRGNQ